MKSLIAAGALGAILAAATVPICAWAHAFLSGEEPRVGSTIDTPPTQVVIKFDNPVEAVFAKLQVTDDSGHDVTTGPPVRSEDKLSLAVPLKPALPPGQYHVKWSVVAEDGHRTEAAYVFTIASHA